MVCGQREGEGGRERERERRERERRERERERGERRARKEDERKEDENKGGEEEGFVGFVWASVKSKRGEEHTIFRESLI